MKPSKPFAFGSKRVAPPRFFALRKEKVICRCLTPARKPRHERCNLQELVKKSEEDYVDFQEAGMGCFTELSKLRVESDHEDQNHS